MTINFGLLLSFVCANLLTGQIFHSLPIHSQFDSNSYWITSSSLSSTELPSIIFGSINGNIHLFTNGSTTLLANLPGAVHGVLYDVNQDGHLDLIVAHKFGNGCPHDCKEADGFLSWVENPKEIGLEWKIHEIGKPVDPAHRVIVVNTALERSFHRLVAIPIAGANRDGLKEFTPFQISFYAFPTNDGVWNEEALTSEFTVCHEGKALQNGFSLSCSQGEAIFRATDIPDQWNISYPIVALSFENEEHTGTSSSTLLDPDTVAFIAPLHGGHIGVTRGNRTVLLDEFERGGHDIQSANFLPNSSSNQFIVAIRETLKSGVYFYEIGDDLNLIQRIRVYDGTPSMLAIGDYDGDGRLDFASIDWGKTNSSKVVIHYNLK